MEDKTNIPDKTLNIIKKEKFFLKILGLFLMTSIVNITNNIIYKWILVNLSLLTQTYLRI